MGDFSLASKVARGQDKIQKLQKVNADVQNAAINLRDAANAYDTFRKADLGDDPDDLTEANERLAIVTQNVQAIFAGFTPGGLMWFEQILDALGYQKKP